MSHQKPVTLKIERTPEELAELKAERERFSRERPGLDDLIASGEFEGPFDHGNVMSLLGAVAELKRRRDEQGLSLATVSERSGLDTGLLSRLENGKILNPMLTTLWRYAGALGVQVSLTVGPPSNGNRTNTDVLEVGGRHTAARPGRALRRGRRPLSRPYGCPSGDSPW